VGPVGSLAAFVPRVGSDLASHGFGPVFFSGRYQVNPLVKETSASLAWPLVLGW
jgi:hypothetical protein